MAPPGNNIFVSYQRESASVALRLRADLINQGFDVWLDTEQIRLSDRWPVTIQRALAAADRMIVLLTHRAVAAVEVFNEWFYFYQHHKPLHLIRLDDCEPHYQLLPFQRLDWSDPLGPPWHDRLDELVGQLRGTYTWPTDDVAPVVTTPFAPTRSLPGALVALEQAVRHPQRPVALSDQQLQEINQHLARSVREYLLTRYARWCGPAHQLDRRFIRLTLVYDEGTNIADRWATAPSTRESTDLRELITDAESFAYVLLGAPGAGKTTLLRRLEMDIARDGLVDPSDPVIPFGVSLAEYGYGSDDAPPPPLQWLEQRWATRNPHLPPLREHLAGGRLLLLLDGLNELAHTDQADLRRRVAAWRAFLYEHIRDIPGNRAVFSCRTLDYGAMLSSKDVGVPHIRLEPMSPAQVIEYVRVNLPEHAALVTGVLTRDQRILSFYRTPYMLRLLVGQVRAVGTVPVGRADAFQSMVRELLRREILAGNQRLTDPAMLTDREQRQLREHGGDPRWLPERGQLIPALTRLAYQMQRAKSGADKGVVVVDYDTAVDLLNGLARLAESSLRVGLDTGILDERDQSIRFFHQLLQEFFAARQLAQGLQPGLVAVPTRVDQVSPSLPEAIAELAPGEPLPPLPTTGWEETATMAAALTRDPDAYIRTILAVNPALAGRCAAAGDVAATPALKRHVADVLVTAIEDPEQDLRARIETAHALTALGDPRLTRIDHDGGIALLPVFVTIPARAWRIGTEDSPYPLERPVHEVSLPRFELARTPVTNAEYGCFIAAGGYLDDRWWRTEAARRWRRGDGLTALIAGEWVKKRDNLRRRPQLPVNMLRTGAATLQQAVSMVKLTAMSDVEIVEALTAIYGSEPPRAPAYWEDSRLNQGGQPVVGVSVYEAEAYCAWLSHVTGTTIRLPSEYEWEAAASSDAQVFPYGNSFDPWAGNTFESHVRTTTPVGVFPQGRSVAGCDDLSGNVFEWTASPATPYPHPHGRPGPDDPGAVRVCRGGSWRHHQLRARAAYRGRGQCFVRNDDLGFRILRDR
ncbi:SUMF1/EgtB/PvdO family nonheme iron enzyme [Micromonospora sp. NBC_01796]|uniref:SUMF1/EgtB/PvdO family nonheme iron enzyme n=1 Tax=Micromonospora sp. NBC_01796 TaxID=2975987 RepID=UPI002DD9996B|nr:SUMF1/EgtB/PvdO family nonheme iron enzyme [Micromonospora sp. NBC_01796]WSA83714.1 SUMF1/EgtB/PvdO family nonheme iron enzyme [Micromonospora sp. NBC_01796]